MAQDEGTGGSSKQKASPSKVKIKFNPKGTLVDQAYSFLLRILPKQDEPNRQPTSTSPAVAKWNKAGMSQNVEDRRPRHKWTDDDGFWTWAEEQWGEAAPRNFSAQMKMEALRQAKTRLMQRSQPKGRLRRKDPNDGKLYYPK